MLHNNTTGSPLKAELIRFPTWSGISRTLCTGTGSSRVAWCWFGLVPQWLNTGDFRNEAMGPNEEELNSGMLSKVAWCAPTARLK